MKEYGMTIMLRLLVSITLLPLGGLLIFGAMNPGKDEVEKVSMLIGALFIVISLLVWVYYTKKRIIVEGNELTVRSVFGETKIKIDDQTKIFHDAVKIGVGRELGVIGGLMQAAAEMGGEAATTNIKVMLRSGKTRIELNSNVKGIVALRDEIIEKELFVIYPAYKERYDRGGKAEFGKVSVSGGVIKSGKKMLSIDKLDPVVVEGGKVLFREKGKRWMSLKVQASKFENLHSFLRLVDEAERRSEA